MGQDPPSEAVAAAESSVLVQADPMLSSFFGQLGGAEHPVSVPEQVGAPLEAQPPVQPSLNDQLVEHASDFVDEPIHA